MKESLDFEDINKYSSATMKKIHSRHTVTAVTSLVITINLRNPEINYNNLLELSGKTFHFLLVVYQGLDVGYSTWI